MNEYQVAYSYKPDIGLRLTEVDVTAASTAQEAVDRVRDWYSDLDGLRVERVWIDRDNRWEITERWE